MSSTIGELNAEQVQFLAPFLPLHIGQTSRQGISNRPYVTVTYACSLDGMISLAPGVRTTLSGLETKSMTHYLRLHHDAILVGVGTAVADSPSLNCRYPGVNPDKQPQPVVVDPHLRWQHVDTPVQKLASTGQGKAPWIVHRGSQQLSADHKAILHLPVQCQEATMQWQDILLTLKQQGIESVMIEGGATVLNSLLLQPELVDAVIVTIAPTWLGQGGVHVSPLPQAPVGQRRNAASLSDTVWKQFGADVVLCGRLGS